MSPVDLSKRIEIALRQDCAIKESELTAQVILDKDKISKRCGELRSKHSFSDADRIARTEFIIDLLAGVLK
jgi:hypothetical protein